MHTRCLEDVDWFIGLSSKRKQDIREAMARNFATQLCVDNNGKPYLSLGNLDEETLMTDAHSIAVSRGFIEKTPKTLIELTREAFPKAVNPRGLRVEIIEDTLPNTMGPGCHLYPEVPEQKKTVIDLFFSDDSKTTDMVVQYHPKEFYAPGGRRDVYKLASSR